MTRKFYEKGMTIQKEGDSIDCFIVVENGLLELVTDFDGNPFTVAKLPHGSICNQKNFFLEEKMKMKLIAHSPTHVLLFSQQQLDVLMDNHVDLKKKFMLYQNKLLKEGKSYPIDVQYTEIPEGRTHGGIKREVILKRIVMNIVEQVRIEKSKPKLSDLLRIFKVENGMQKGFDKEAILKKLH